MARELFVWICNSARRDANFGTWKDLMSVSDEYYLTDWLRVAKENPATINATGSIFNAIRHSHLTVASAYSQNPSMVHGPLIVEELPSG